MDTKFYYLLAAFLFMPTFISCADRAALEIKVSELTKDLDSYSQTLRFDEISYSLARDANQIHLAAARFQATKGRVQMTEHLLDKAKEALAAAKK